MSTVSITQQVAIVKVDEDIIQLSLGAQQGPAGAGVPLGGSTGQVLAKASNADIDTMWVNQTGGGGSLTVTEVDGSPTGTPTTLKVPNGTLTFVGAVATFAPNVAAITGLQADLDAKASIGDDVSFGVVFAAGGLQGDGAGIFDIPTSGVTGLDTALAGKSAAFTNSAGLAALLSDETGSAGGGVAVFSNSPVMSGAPQIVDISGNVVWQFATGTPMFEARLQSSTANRAVADLIPGWVSSTDAFRSGYLSIGAYYTSAFREGIRVVGASGGPQIGFLGATPVSQQSDLTGLATMGLVAAGTLPESAVVNLVSDLAGKQPIDSDLTAIAALITTTFGRSLLTQADSSATRTTLGLGTLAVISGGFTGGGTLATGGFTLTVGAAASISGANTGDQTSVTGNAGTATALQTPRAINGVNFDGTAAITVTCSAGTLTGTALNATVVSSSLTSVGTLTAGATGAGFTIALTTSTVTGNLPAANMPALTGAVTSSAGSTATAQVVEANAYVDPPANATYPLVAKSSIALTINQIRGLKTASGTCTLAIQINGTNVTGLSGLSVTSTPQDANATALNTVSAGDRVTFVVSSISGPTGLEFTLKGTR